MELYKSKVYIRTDENSRILLCEGGYSIGNIKNIDDWICIDEGVGDRYNLCQSNYFDKLYTEDGIHRYKWDGEKAILRSDVEIEADRAKLPKPEPTQLDRIEAAVTARNEEIAQAAIDNYTLELMEGGIL